jgi:REP element-mobilizing transposase RayT
LEATSGGTRRATWRRLPLINESVERQLHQAIDVKCRQRRCEPLAIGGVADHVHVLVRLSPSVSIARLTGEAKGFSSYLMTHQIAPGRFFRWQERYSALTVASEDVDAVASYVRKQREHHRTNRVVSDFELPDLWDVELTAFND